jgi:S-DNA-T family DNA segregation ATPase FtsK/SpoIIIE
VAREALAAIGLDVRIERVTRPAKGASVRATVTIVTTRNPAGEDVVITAPSATSSEEIAARIATALGLVPAERAMTVDGEPVDRSLPIAATGLRDGAIVVLDDDAQPTASTTRGAAVVPDSADGHRRVSRPPRLGVVDPAADARRVEFPTRPQERPSTRLPVIATVAPLVAGLALTAVLRRPEYLLFTVLSPLMMAGQWIADRVGQRRAARTEAATCEAALAAARDTLADALAGELAERRTWSPDPAAVTETAVSATHRLWERRRHDPDFTVVRLGSGEVPAATAPSTGETPTLVDAPIVVRLHDVGVLGLAGPRARVSALARWIVTQLAVLHSPRAVAIVVLARPVTAGDWAWTRWLPHLRPADGTRSQALVGLDEPTVAARVAELNALIRTRRDASRQGASGQGALPRHVVVLIDGARTLRSTPGLADVLRDGPSAGVLAVCLETDAALLPEECAAVARFSDDVSGRMALSIANASVIRDVGADVVGADAAERVARALAPLRDDTPSEAAGALPDSVRFLDVVALPPGSADQLAAELSARWRLRSGSTAAPLGVGTGAGHGDTFDLDIARDGPHALVAGTTGSGKSELLQTLVASLALANRPDELTFVLVDYKGGAAFGACGTLPHTVGLVTDLDGNLAERALVSLTAELKRREGLFAAARAIDIDTYRASGRILARLVIVVDEFASLAEELPDFVGGLVGIAQRGRSLGVHLVLATQRPEGVVSADIRANTNLRICLAVTRESESRDVIEAPDAARISRLTPGRGYARTGHGELRAFQCGRVGGPRRADSVGARARISPFRALGYPEPSAKLDVDERRAETDLDVIVAACDRAAKYLDIEAPASPWLPPLPDVVTSSEVIDAPLTATLGWRDLPALQTREPYVVDLSDFGHLVVAGSARSGRTAALRTLAALLARGTSTADLHVYAFDCAGGALTSFASLPHCGAVIATHEPDRARRLVSLLIGELATRRAELAAQGFGSVTEQRERSCAPLPHVAVFIDGWESFLSSFDDVDGGRVIDGMFELLRDGASAGIHVIATADRGGLVGRLASLVDQRLVLRLADRSDFTLIGLPTRAVPEKLPAGRAFSAHDLTQLQICLLSGDPAGPAQLEAFASIARAATIRDEGVAASSRPRRVDELPAHVVLEELEKHVGRRGVVGGARVLLGVGGDQVEPRWADLADSGPGFVIAGPPRSGRSTALACVATSLRSAGWLTVLITTRGSPVGGYVDAGYDARDPLLARALEAPHQAIAVLVDDAERVLDAPAAGPLERFAREASDGGHLLVVAGTTDDLAIGFRGFVVEARRSRCGVLLAPRGPLDGEVFGVRLPRDTGGRMPPGRGLLVEHGAITPLQVAAPTAPVTSRR